VLVESIINVDRLDDVVDKTSQLKASISLSCQKLKYKYTIKLLVTQCQSKRQLMSALGSEEHILWKWGGLRLRQGMIESLLCMQCSYLILSMTTI